MQTILSNEEINKFKEDGAIFLKGKFDINWIKKLQKGIERDIKIRALDLNRILLKRMFRLI